MKVTFEGKPYDAAALLAALHNGTRAQGLGLLQETALLTRAQAERILEESRAHQQRAGRTRYAHGFVFDYVNGRPLKVRADPDGVIDEHSAALYDRDAGKGAFRRALAEAEAFHG